MIRNLKDFEDKLLRELLDGGLIDKETKTTLLKERAIKKLSFFENIHKNKLIDEEQLIDILVSIYGAKKLSAEQVPKANTSEEATTIYRDYGVLIGHVGEHSVEVYMHEPIFADAEKKLSKSLSKEIVKIVVSKDKYQKIETEVGSIVDYRENSTLSTQEELESLPPGQQAVKFVDEILQKSILLAVSDIHIEPMKTTYRLRMRIDGVLQFFGEYDMSMYPAIASRFKLISNLDIAEKRKTQDGALVYRFMKKDKEVETPFRVSIMPTIYGEKIVMRILGSDDNNLTLEMMGMGDKIMEDWKKTIAKPYGLILVSGPTGSGKSTSLFAAINEINDIGINITTIEDPVEAKIPGVNQVQIDSHKVSFADALRSILRQDPDVLMVGEVRDTETAEIAIKASLTGHMVFATIHTNDASSTVTRIVDMGIKPFLVSSSIVGILAQRLARRLCKNCKIKKDAIQGEVDFLHGDMKVGDPIFHQNKEGCDVCNHTGYKGRVGIYEYLVIDDELKKMINAGATSQDIEEYAVNNLGMQTLFGSVSSKVINGITTAEEALRVVSE